MKHIWKKLQTRRAAIRKSENLAFGVTSCVAKFEMDVGKKLVSAKTRLAQSGAPDRALESRVETLSGVLELLQGKSMEESFRLRELREEITGVRLELRAGEEQHAQTDGELRTQLKICRNIEKALQHQMEVSHRAKMSNRKLSNQMKEARRRFASRLSLESSIGRYLRSRLHSYEQRPPGQISAESSSDPHLSGPGPQVEMETFAVSVRRDEPTETFHALGPRHDVGSDLLVSGAELGKETGVVSLRVGHLKKIMDEALFGVSDTYGDTLKSQTEEIAALEAALKVAEEQTRGVLQRQTELESQLKEENARRSKRRSWYSLLFGWQ